MMTIPEHRLMDLWNSLRKKSTAGVVKQLYDSELFARIYATYRASECSYGIACTFDPSIKIDVSGLGNMRELRVSKLNDSSFSHAQMLLVELTAPEDNDIFASLCENLIFAVHGLNEESRIAQVVLYQLERWKKLLSQTKTQGLSHEEQQGLFGELVFLEKLLSNHIMDTPLDAVSTWVGMEPMLRDFKGEGWAVEVKTVSGGNPQKICINGERQLDETLLNQLFMFHLSVDKAAGSGHTLCQQVETVRELLQDDGQARLVFDNKLIAAGCLKPDSYDETHYAIRNEKLYTVRGDFPRIKENELRNGVGDVDYKIDASACADYAIPFDQLTDYLR